MVRFSRSAADVLCALRQRCGTVPEVTARHAALSLGATGHVRILPQLSHRAKRSADSLFINYRYVTVTSEQQKEGKHSAFGRPN